MTEYYVDIIDTLDDTHTTILESAQKDSINLSYEGKDALDELQIVGSALAFNMNVPSSNDTDAVFSHLFTGDENRYRVELRRQIDDLLIWNGFLLPDSYSEPYTGSTYFVDFEAVDGLGRLKGKYLSDALYASENTVTVIVARCLVLTGLQMEIIFSPGIDNRLEKRWDNIFLDGQLFYDGNKKLDAYTILENICNDTASCVYQHLGQWFFEGLNKRNLTTYEAKKYNFKGVYISNYQVIKQVKNLNNRFLKNPLVTIVPPFNEIEVTYTDASVSFPETIFEENNDGWVVFDGYSGKIYASDWFGNNGFYAEAEHPNYQVYLRGSNNASFDTSKYVQLQRKIYLQKNQKVRLEAEFEIDFYGAEDDDLITDLILSTIWNNPLKYDVYLGASILYSNRTGEISTGERLYFRRDKKASFVFDFIPQTSGLLDIRLYQPSGLYTENRIRGFYINSLVIEEIGFEEDKRIADTISQDYTIDKELELTYTDNVAGVGSVFRLAKLNLDNELLYNTISVPVLYGVTYNGVNYASVSLEGANLISDNIDTVELDGSVLSNLEVIYNFNGGEQMLVKTPTLLDDSDTLDVKVYKKFDHDLVRDHWQEWTDSLYQIERKRLPKAVLGVYRRLFDTPKNKIEGVADKMLILFGDMISFNYREDKTFSVLKTTMNFDSGNSKVTMFESVYIQEESDISPIVDAGPDIFLIGSQNNVFLNATAFDPDGTIETYLWQKLSGATGDFIQSPSTEDTNISGLTGDDYTYQITVTDNDGNSASDTCRILRQVNYTADLVEVEDNSYGSGSDVLRQYLYDLEVDPTLPNNVFISFNAVISLFITANAIFGNTSAYVRIFKNNITIADFSIDTVQNPAQVFNTTFLYSASDNIQVKISALSQTVVNNVLTSATIRIETATILDYPGTVIGLPIIKTAQAEATV